MDSQRNPHVLVDARMTSHPKLVELSSDGARWAWLMVLCEAKLQRPAGRFASRRVLEHVLGSYAQWVGELVDAGLLEEAPLLCDRCAEVAGDAPHGTIIVHDWVLHQERRRQTERQARWRRRPSTTPSTTPSTPSSTGPSTRASTSASTPPSTPTRAGARPLQSQSQSQSDHDSDSAAAAAAVESFRGSTRTGGSQPRARAREDPPPAWHDAKARLAEQPRPAKRWSILRHPPPAEVAAAGGEP